MNTEINNVPDVAGNFITNTDSYKFLNNVGMVDVENIFSYFESRDGAKYPTTVFIGLQYFLKRYFEGVVITQDKIEQAAIIAKFHLGSAEDFNREAWQTIVDEYGGKLPLIISAVPEGTEVETGNPLMTIELSVDDKRVAGVVNHAETILTNVWGVCVASTKSKYIKRLIKSYLEETSDSIDGLSFMLHDFAQRSVKVPEQAATSGFGHLAHFLGTDTVLAWELARDYYQGDVENIGFSVWASEHNRMMYKGREGEGQVLEEILDQRPTGIISVVSDTYDIYNFVDNTVGKIFKDRILSRDGVFVVRPDSVTPDHNTPAKICLWILESLWRNFGGKLNNKGYKVLDQHVRLIYGDSLQEESIEEILRLAKTNGYSSENLVFGCGSYLLDKHNRDTQRFAYKSSCMKINGVWQGVNKDPIGSNKTSKKGRLKLVKGERGFFTLSEFDKGFAEAENQLVPVFKDGEILKSWSLEEIRKLN